jgi:hypothetical protein
VLQVSFEIRTSYGQLFFFKDIARRLVANRQSWMTWCRKYRWRYRDIRLMISMALAWRFGRIESAGPHLLSNETLMVVCEEPRRPNKVTALSMNVDSWVYLSNLRSISRCGIKHKRRRLRGGRLRCAWVVEMQYSAPYAVEFGMLPRWRAVRVPEETLYLVGARVT